MKFFFETQHNSLVIGANGAIGSACVKAMKNAGADVTEIDLSYPSQETKQNKFLKCDVSNIEDVTNSAKKIKSIHSVIYAVGLNYDSNVIDTNWKEYRKVMSANLDSAFHVAKVYGKRMANQSFGSFVFLSSFAGLRGEAGASIYCASKFGVNAFNTGLRIDLNKTGIKVGIINPGKVKTEFSNVRFKGDSLKAKKVYEGLKVLSAEDVANAIFYMANVPDHVNISDLEILPNSEANTYVVNRNL